MARREEQQAMEGLLRRSFARESDAGACPDTEILAAYFERSLGADEIPHYELHFSQCARCREQLAALARINEAVGAGDGVGEKSGHRPWLFGWHWLAPAALAMSLVLVWFIRYRVQTRTNAHPWTAPMVSMMKDQPSSGAAANQAPAPSGDVALTLPPAPRQENAPADLKSPSVVPKIYVPSAGASGASSAKELAKKESDENAAGAVARGSLADREFGRARVEHAVGQPANEAKAQPAAAPRPSIAMNSSQLQFTPPAMQSPTPGPPPASAKPDAPIQGANRLDNAVPSSGGQAPSGASASGTANGVTGAAGAAITPTPVVPMATQSVVVTEASAPVAATDQNPSTTSNLTQTVIGGQAQVADSGSANANAAAAKAKEEQKVADAKSAIAAAQSNQRAGNPAYAARLKSGDADLPSAGQMILATGYVMIATPDPAVFWRIAPDGFVEHSTDTGATWEGTQISSHEPLLAGSAPERNVCWLVGRDGLILVTRDARRWKQLEPPVRMDIVSVEAKDASSATIKLADGTRYETSDGGKKWHAVQ